MGRLTLMRRLSAALALVALSGCSSLGRASSAVEVVPVAIHYSAFEPREMRFEVGTTVEFVIHNADPIAHEFIVGPREIHRRHERGTEAEHGEVPGEVSIPANSTATTTYTFTRPGRVVFACHLPGHLRYGMKGFVTVTG